MNNCVLEFICQHDSYFSGLSPEFFYCAGLYYMLYSLFLSPPAPLLESYRNMYLSSRVANGRNMAATQPLYSWGGCWGGGEL